MAARQMVIGTFGDEVRVGYIVEWEESERGWGCRPDGCSVHSSQEEALRYINECNSRLPKDHVPDEYSRPIGDPIGVRIPNELYELLKKNGSIRYWRSNCMQMTTDATGARTVTAFEVNKEEKEMVEIRRSVSISELNFKNGHSICVDMSAPANVIFVFDPDTKQLVDVKLNK